jgi:Na+/H+-dicarboxylate symporter
MRKLALHWQILIAIALALVAGYAVNLSTSDSFTPNLFGVSFVSMFAYIGELFLNALKMIIVPLITSSIIVGVAGIGSGGNLGALGGKTLLFYAATTLAAILIGLAVINLLSPGIVDGQPARDLLALDASSAEVAQRVEGRGVGDVAEVFLRMIPPNIVQAAAEGQMLGMIFFALLFGYFMTHLSHELAEPLFNFWNGVFHVMMKMTEWIMLFAPIGVFGLVAKVVADTGFGAAGSLATFAFAVILALALHALVVLPLLLFFIGRVRPFAVIKGVAPALLTAFSTASSSATLPVTMDSVEDNLGVSNKISSFVLPLGATVNMNGTALYECAAAMFLAQAYGLDLNFGVQFTIVTIALMTSIGVAGVPSASLVAIAIILAAIGLPVEAIGVLMVFDRVLDMLRTSVNIWGDVTCATIIARLEGEQTRVAL